MAELTRKQKEWSVHLERQKLSGLSRVAYCNQHGLKPESMAYFASKLNRETRDQMPSNPFLQIPVRMSPTMAVLKMAGGVSLEIPSDPALLAHIVKSLK